MDLRDQKLSQIKTTYCLKISYLITPSNGLCAKEGVCINV